MLVCISGLCAPLVIILSRWEIWDHSRISLLKSAAALLNIKYLNVAYCDLASICWVGIVLEYDLLHISHLWYIKCKWYIALAIDKVLSLDERIVAWLDVIPAVSCLHGTRKLDRIVWSVWRLSTVKAWYIAIKWNHSCELCLCSNFDIVYCRKICIAFCIIAGKCLVCPLCIARCVKHKACICKISSLSLWCCRLLATLYLVNCNAADENLSCKCWVCIVLEYDLLNIACIHSVKVELYAALAICKVLTL